MQRAFRASTKLKFACPSERIPVFFLFIWTCFALIIIAISYRHYIILVYRAGVCTSYETPPTPVHDPGRICRRPQEWEDMKGQGRGEYWLFHFVLFVGAGARCPRNGANTSGRSTHALLTHNVTWSGTRGQVFIPAGIRT